MSDSSDDESKDMNKESEVSSSCSNGRQNRGLFGDEPKPRSLSPDTSDAVEQAGPSHQVDAPVSSADPTPAVELHGEALTSTTGNGRGERRVAESSHQEGGVSSGETVAGRSVQPAVSSALVGRDDAKSSSSDEYFEADATAFEPLLELADVSGSQDRSSLQEPEVSVADQISTARHPWELDISSESNSQDAIVSGQLTNPQQLAISESNSQEAEATLRHPQKSWEMLLSYESSSDDGEAGSSNQQLLSSAQPTVSGSQSIVDQVSEAREISTTQQQSACVSPSNSQEPELSEDENGQQETVTGSASADGASSSEIRAETAAVSGSQDRSVAQEAEAGSSGLQDQSVAEEAGSSTLQVVGQPEICGSRDQLLTSSGQASQEVDVTESLRISQDVESSPCNQLLSSSQQADVSDSQEEEVVEGNEEEEISSGQPQTEEVDVSESQNNSQEAEASVSVELASELCSTAVESESGTSRQRFLATVSGSDDNEVMEVELSSTIPASSSVSQPVRPSRTEAGQRRVDVSGSNDVQEEIGMSSSTVQRPDSPSSPRATERVPNAQVTGASSGLLSGRLREIDDEMASSSGPTAAAPVSSREAEQEEPVSIQAESSAEPAVSAVVDRPTRSSDEERSSAQLSVSSATQRQRPPEPARMSVLAQQLTVSSASGRSVPGLMPRQMISSQNEAGFSSRQSNVGPDSTTMDQSADTGEEVSTTEEEQPGQVSTSQQRVVSTSWPPHFPSRVSSSVDSSAGHISTSVRPGGLLASRLSRDPQVSTSANAAPLSRDLDSTNGGASSTTSGLRGLLSSAPRPAGVSSSRPRLNRNNFSPPSQSSMASSPLNRTVEVSPEQQNVVQSDVGSSLASPPSTTPQPSSSSSQKPSNNQDSNRNASDSNRADQQLAGPSEPSQSGPSQSLCTAPGDKFPNDPGKRPKKRKKSPAKDPAPPKQAQAGPSRDHSSSLMEQLRKAGVIVTSVPAVPSHSQSTPLESSNNEMDAESVNVVKVKRRSDQSTPSHPGLRVEQIDSSSSDDIQVLGMFGKVETPPQRPEVLTLTESPEESTGIEEVEAMVVEEEAQEKPNDEEDDGKPKRKRRPRKPIEVNPDMLRPKRPRKAKERPEDEEEINKDKPKRGRKKKVQPDAAAEVKPDTKPEEVIAAPLEEVLAPVLPEETPEVVALPEKPKGGKAKEKAPRTPKSKPVREPPSRPQDEDTRMSADDSQQSRPPLSSVESTPRKRFAIQTMPELEVVAESLVEYQWPLSDRLAESFMIQEQVTQYLGIKSFKRKYPDLKRRPVEPEEREFLHERGLVSEAMCDLGLTAVQSSEVLDIMSADFQDKYEEFRRAQRDKQAREVSGKQKAAAAASGERGRQVDQKARAMQSAAKWNASLNRERREERRCCCDLQTLAVQFPQARVKAMTKETPRLGTYPVALIPGQFTDFYKRYTPAELRYLPVSTVLYGPLRPNEHDERGSEGSPSESEDSSSSDESSSSSSSEGTQDTEETGSTAAEPEQDVPAGAAGNGPAPGSKCKVCALPGNHPDSMVSCAQCSSNGHLGCLGLSTDMLPHIRRYAWQCTDCKTCIQCKDPADEDKMLFCDMCDRGYHIYCVGLRKVPMGRWHCQECAVCGSCGSLDPGGAESLPVSPPASPDKIPPQWQHEFKKGEKGARIYAQTLCMPCSKLWRRGSFCQLCYRCFRKPDLTAMLSCSVCDKWMHAECCSLGPGVELPKMAGNFVCEVCQEGSQVRATPTRVGKSATRA